MRMNRMTVIVSLLIILVFICFIILPPSKGRIPVLTDENGNIIDGSISEKCYVQIDGCNIGMIILSKDINNPVLLVCGGGPGIPEYLLENSYPSNLCEKFTVCFWDYRGTGLSYYSELLANEMTTKRYILDTVEITKYLQNRFSKEKIYIMGHSFGTYVAINTVSQYPDYYDAYIAMSQICNQKESEYMAYDYMKEQYILQNNRKMVKKFEECPIRESDEMYSKYFSSSLRDTSMHDLGVGTCRDMDSVITGIFFPSLRCRAYTPKERVNIWRGKSDSMNFPVVNDATHFNVFDEVTSLKLPIYFFAGKYDYTCNYDLQYEYYENIDAPVKKFFAFENSAHSPIFEEPGKAAECFDMIE